MRNGCRMSVAATGSRFGGERAPQPRDRVLGRERLVRQAALGAQPGERPDRGRSHRRGPSETAGAPSPRRRRRPARPWPSTTTPRPRAAGGSCGVQRAAGRPERPDVEAELRVGRKAAVDDVLLVVPVELAPALVAPGVKAELVAARGDLEQRRRIVARVDGLDEERRPQRERVEQIQQARQRARDGRMPAPRAPSGHVPCSISAASPRLSIVRTIVRGGPVMATAVG